MAVAGDNPGISAAWLEAHPAVKTVNYPGLESDPQHDLARRQMHAFRGMVSTVLKGGLEEDQILERCRIFSLAESLGGVESLIEHPGIMTHASIPADVSEELCIDDSLVRISVAVEDVGDLIADLAQALEG